MRIALVTTGRFTLVDLARELSQRGHDVKVYSLVPPFRNHAFDLPNGCNRWLGVRALPFYAGVRYLPEGRIKNHVCQALNVSVDNRACEILEPCDALISMSGIGVRVLDEARRRFGARIFVERSSVHIIDQRDILQRMPGSTPTFASSFMYERELLSYALADVITVPSQHVYDSFIERGYPPARVFKNLFGIVLDDFPATSAPPKDARPTIIMTGAWSRQKGCDVLVEAWRKLPGTRLLHVGPVADLPLPRDEHFSHVDTVPQAELARFYGQAHVFALASRQDGSALVIVQALACGLPVVCTTRTAGPDLKQWTLRPNDLQTVAPGDPDAFAAALQTALDNAVPAGTMRDVLGQHREEMSWAASARRYEERLLAAIRDRPVVGHDAVPVPAPAVDQTQRAS